MSVGIIQSFPPPPLKRARETISLSRDGASKCAEIFVTNNADKWTFFCAYCQKATCDIGAFICHIRLEHLNSQSDQTSELQSNIPINTNAEASTQTTQAEDELTIDGPQHTPQNDIIKEEITIMDNEEQLQSICSKVSQITDITSMEQPESVETEDLLANKNPLATSYPADNSQQEYFLITQIDESAKNHNTENIEDRTNNLGFNSKLPFSCKECHKAFPTTRTLNEHKKSHDNKRHLPCPLCPTKHKERMLITHILTHESANCFPCQVCGIVYNSQDERLTHWKTHANEQPFDCKLCYRRFSRLEYLTNHLKTHKQYRCIYCACEVYSNAVLTDPYVCSECEKLPVIKQKEEPESSFDQTSLAYDLNEETITICNQAEQEFIELPSTSNRNDEAIDDLNNDSNTRTSLSPKKEFLNDDELSNEFDSSSVEFIAVDDDDDVPSGSVSKITTPFRVGLEGDSLTYICTYCERVFISEKALILHTKVHINNNDVTNKCSFCHKCFQSKSVLKSHLKSHHKKKYICSLCPLTYSKQNPFISHVLLHENDSCFPCQICGKIFANNDERLAHCQIHIKDLPYGCDFCYRRFSKKYFQSRHLKTHQEYYGDSKGKVKNSIATSNRSHNIQDEYFVVTLVDKEDSSQQSQLNEEVTEKNDTDSDESDTVSCYSANETNDTHSESHQDNIASYRKPHTKRRRKNLGVEEDTELLHHKCPYCKLGYKTKQAVFQHILHNHDENYHQKLPWKCEECHRGFLTTSGLNAHLKSHDKDRHLQCPVCLSKHKDNYFITHVMTHESDTCFPCQVCGQLYNSHKERMQHWEIHAEDKPFYCKICYRRFRKQQYLTHHLKTHNKYQCNFCPEQFNSPVTQRPPYVCSSCKDLPDIKQHIKHLRSLAYNSHVFESDEETLTTFPKPLEEVTAAQHNEELIDNKQISQRNQESSNEPNNDSNANAAVSVNEEIENEGAFSYEDGSDLEFIDETLDGVDNDDNVPSGSGHNISPSHQQTIQSEEGLYNCLHCKRAFNTQRALSTHTKRTHINQSAPNCPYNCSYCNRGFQTKTGLNFHEKTHDKNKYEFKCPLCSITTFRECDFITHVLSHESPTCYPCQVCGKIYSSSEERLAHWATHVQERPYGCKFCYRRFARKQILHRHMRSHKQ